MWKASTSSGTFDAMLISISDSVPLDVFRTEAEAASVEGLLDDLNTGAGFTKGLRLRLSQGLKSESFVFARSWT